MKAQKAQKLNHGDIQHLAYLNWEKDGCQHGLAINYWLEAEQQLKESWRLLIQKPAPTKRTTKTQTAVVDKSKAKPSIKIKISASPKAAQL
jgi:hypothetical protein